MSARTQLAAKLSTVLDSKTFSVIEAETLPDKIEKATVVVRFREYTPAPNALGSLIATFIVTLAVTKTEPRAAETELDQRLPDVLAALKAVPRLRVSAIRKAKVKDLYAGLDYELTLPVNITELNNEGNPTP